MSVLQKVPVLALVALLTTTAEGADSALTPNQPGRAPASPSATPVPKRQVEEVLIKAQSDPQAAQELSALPIELVFDGLRRCWTTDNDPMARDLLLAHPDFESYVVGRLEHSKDVLERGTGDREYSHAFSQFFDDLLFARLCPPRMAVRMLGPMLFAKYYPDEDADDYISQSPAAMARNSLAAVASVDLGEEVPAHVEDARKWWTANAARFGLPAKGEPGVSPLVQRILSSLGPVSNPGESPVPSSTNTADQIVTHSTMSTVHPGNGGQVEPSKAPGLRHRWAIIIGLGILTSLVGVCLWRRDKK